MTSRETPRRLAAEAAAARMCLVWKTGGTPLSVRRTLVYLLTVEEEMGRSPRPPSDPSSQMRSSCLAAGDRRSSHASRQQWGHTEGYLRSPLIGMSTHALFFSSFGAPRRTHL